MNFTIVIKPHIPEQIFSISEFYDEKSYDLGNKVETEIYATFDRIELNPNQFQVINKNIRRVLVKKFPLAIFYVVFELNDNRILILDILPQAANPESWPDPDEI